MHGAGDFHCTQMEQWKSAGINGGEDGVKLTVLTLGHKSLGILPSDFVHSAEWKFIFWEVLLGIVAVGALISVKKKKEFERIA